MRIEKFVKTITYMAGIVDMISLLSLDSECWVPIIGVLVSTAWLLLVIYATFEWEGEDNEKN